MGEDKNVVRLGGLADWKEPNSSPSGAPSEDLSFVKGEGELEWDDDNIECFWILHFHSLFPSLFKENGSGLFEKKKNQLIETDCFK